MTLPAILYPAIQAPPAIATEAAIEARWHQPFSTPAKLTRAGLSAAILAGSLFWHPSVATAAQIVTVDKYQRPLSEPVRRDPRAAVALASSGQPAWPTMAAIIDAANVRWHAPFSLPVRYPRDQRYAALLAGGEYPGSMIQANPPPIIGPDYWQRPFAEPQRFPRDPRFIATLSAGPLDWPVIASINDQANVRWMMPLSLPTRRKVPSAPGGLSFEPSFAPRADVASRAWFRPLTEPRRFLRNPRFGSVLLGGEVQPVIPAILGNANVRWFAPFSLPVRYRRDPRYSALLTGGETAWSMVESNPPPPPPNRPVSMRTGLLSGAARGAIRAGHAGTGIRAGRAKSTIGT